MKYVYIYIGILMTVYEFYLYLSNKTEDYFSINWLKYGFIFINFGLKSVEFAQGSQAVENSENILYILWFKW